MSGLSMCDQLKFLPALRYRKSGSHENLLLEKQPRKLISFFCSDYVENKTISARLSSLLSLDKREGGGGDGDAGLISK